LAPFRKLIAFMMNRSITSGMKQSKSRWSILRAQTVAFQ